jgi:hypothetical protein
LAGAKFLILKISSKFPEISSQIPFGKKFSPQIRPENQFFQIQSEGKNFPLRAPNLVPRFGAHFDHLPNKIKILLEK